MPLRTANTLPHPAFTAPSAGSGAAAPSVPPAQSQSHSPGRRTAIRAVGAAAGAVLVVHLAATFDMGLDSLMGIGMLALAFVCLPCVVMALRWPCDAKLRMLLLSSALVAGLHLVLTIATFGGGHVHGGEAVQIPDAPAGDGVALASGYGIMFVLAGLEYAVGLAAAAVLLHGRAERSRRIPAM
ncbi:MAG: hypothetical protein ACTH31_06670 [Pseudoclavibacter sp.]